MPRTLICILNQVRAAEITWPSFKKFVLDELDADLCLAIGIDEDCRADNPYVANAKFLFGFQEQEDWSKAFDYAQQAVFKEVKADSALRDANWREVFKVGGQWLGPMGAQQGSGGIGLFFRWWLHHNVYEMYGYDRFVVTRSDFLWTCPHPPLDLLDPKNIWIPEGEDYGGYCDRHMVLSDENFDGALSSIEDILLLPEWLTKQLNVPELGGLNCESYFAWHLRRVGLADKVRCYPQVAYTVRGEHGKTRWMAGEYNPELGYAIKYHREWESARKYESLIRTREDWKGFL